jgi:ankyrin repeat protein
LHHAVEQGHLSAVEILLRSNANVNASAQGEVAPLHIAVQRTNKAMVELLITNRADVNARTFIQATPLLQAAAVGKAGEIVKILLQAGAELNARDKYGNSALLLAAAAEPDGVAELLIQAGADVTVQEKAAGFTALHHAVLRGNRPLVELLLAKKADCQAPLADGETPLSLALFEDRKEIAELLRQQGAKLPPEKPLTEIERSLVEDYRRYHQMLATGTFEEIRKRQQELSPTRAEVNRIFLKSAEIAWDILERVRRDEALAWGAASRNADDKQSFLAMMRNGARMGEYLRIEILPASPSVKSAQARNLIAADAPVYQLQIKRRGGETFTVGDYYLVGQRWIIMPALSQVFQELAPPP